MIIDKSLLIIDKSLLSKLDVEIIVEYEDLGVAGTPYKRGFICNFSGWQIDILCDMILFNSKTWSADMNI